MGIDVKGKMVLIFINDFDWEMKMLEGIFGGCVMIYYGCWIYKYEEVVW